MELFLPGTRMDGNSLLYFYATKPIASILPPAEQDTYQLRLEGVPVGIEPQPWLFGIVCTLAETVLGFALNAVSHRR